MSSTFLFPLYFLLTKLITIRKVPYLLLTNKNVHQIHKKFNLLKQTVPIKATE